MLALKLDLQSGSVFQFSPITFVYFDNYSSVTSECSLPAVLQETRLAPPDAIFLSRLHQAASSPHPAPPGTSP